MAWDRKVPCVDGKPVQRSLRMFWGRVNGMYRSTTPEEHYGTRLEYIDHGQFEDTLIFERVETRKGGAGLIWTSKRFNCKLYSFSKTSGDLIRNSQNGVINGVFEFVKRGDRFGIKWVCHAK